MTTPPPGNNTTRHIGVILVVVGTLWLALTGLCTGAVLIGLLGEGNLRDISVILTLAVPSALIGAAIYAVGRWLRPQ